MSEYYVKAVTHNTFVIITPSGSEWHNQHDEVARFRYIDTAQACCDGLNDPSVDWRTVKIEGAVVGGGGGWISYAETFDGIPLEDDQLEKLNAERETWGF
jgi:hypothetical protein